jgi:hypothetical protein
MLDGKPIFAVLTGIDNPSRNPKTGPMGQVWIMRSDINPIEATRINADVSVCGSCPLKGDKGVGRACYVQLFQAPNQIFKSKALLKKPPKNVYRHRAIRLGAYGDMAALPTEITRGIVEASVMTTGYTHQWKTCDQELSKYLMASCDSAADRALAVSMGWHTFRVKHPDQPRLKGEVPCPASKESKTLTTCYSCGRCNGQATKDVVINVHGIGSKHFNLLIQEELTS